MNGKICKRLRAVAKTLPTIYEQKKVCEKLHLDEMPEHLRKDGNGKRLRDSYYNKKGDKVKIARTVAHFEEGHMDHFENLKVAYTQGGNEAVTKYCVEVNKLQKEQDIKHAKIKSENMKDGTYPKGKFYSDKDLEEMVA